MKIGHTQTLTITEKNSSGVMLEDETGWKAFLPKIFLREEKKDRKSVV